MKAVKKYLVILLCLILLSSFSFAKAQDDQEEEPEDESGCIFATFCVLILFLMFLAYMASRRKSERSWEGRAEERRSYPRSQAYRYPPPRTAFPPSELIAVPPKPTPQKSEVKCDLCNSKNLRFFEDGYVKCNDCRHVFYITEGYGRK